MLLLLSLLVTLQPSFAEAVQHAYAHRDAERLRTLLARADTQVDSLLVRYRLYPLTEEASVVEDIPRRLDEGSARAWALLSGLWSYRAGEASIFSAVDYGRHSAHLLEIARQRNPDNPFVLLIGGQSLLFRPAIAGRDVDAAASRFAQLERTVRRNSADGITVTEARVWRWLALRELGRDSEAKSLAETLRSKDLPPLYRQFLNDPPEV